MNELHLFHSEEFGKIRGFLDDKGNPWFVAKDVCDALDLSDVSMTIRSLDADEKGTNTICTPGGKQAMATVNEFGLYSLILKSRKEEAKKFKRWITHEVIPAIRKTGQYTNPHAEQTVTVEVENDFTLKYVSALRQMARMKAYPDCMRVKFLAEAASILSGYPMERFMPPAEELCPLFQ